MFREGGVGADATVGVHAIDAREADAPVIHLLGTASEHTVATAIYNGKRMRGLPPVVTSPMKPRSKRHHKSTINENYSYPHDDIDCEG